MNYNQKIASLDAATESCTRQRDNRAPRRRGVRQKHKAPRCSTHRCPLDTLLRRRRQAVTLVPCREHLENLEKKKNKKTQRHPTHLPFAVLLESSLPSMATWALNVTAERVR